MQRKSKKSEIRGAKTLSAHEQPRRAAGWGFLLRATRLATASRKCFTKFRLAKLMAKKENFIPHLKETKFRYNMKIFRTKCTLFVFYRTKSLSKFAEIDKRKSC